MVRKEFNCEIKQHGYACVNRVVVSYYDDMMF